MNTDKIMMLGVNYESCSLEKRESFFKNNIEGIIENLIEQKVIKGYIVLATCLRKEFYLELCTKDAREIVKTALDGIELSVFKNGGECIEYLFHLVCGFHSVIKGEDQILSQIKKSLFTAQENSHSSKLLNIIFNKGIALGKEFRTKTNIAGNGLSIEGLTVNFLKKILNEELHEKKILILGVGELAKSLLRILKKYGCKNIVITNRTTHKAFELKEKFSCNMISFKEKYQAVGDSDIIISATSAPHYLIRKEELEPTLKEKDYIFMDLAVPRDIDPQISQLKKVSLYNLEHILEIYKENKNKRDAILEKYTYLLKERIREVIMDINNSGFPNKEIIVIGTRGSKLALAQAEYTKSILESKNSNIHCEIKIIVTTGDKDLVTHYNNSDSSLKSFFTKEIEQELLDRKIDIAVHSMKDMPSMSPKGLICGAIPDREDNRDVIISRLGDKLEELPINSVIGTSSLRRTLGVGSIREDFQIKPIRGNIHTRIKKLESGEYDAIVLAAAGLKRVGLEHLITEYLSVEQLIPAPAQGALYIQCRENDKKILKYLKAIHNNKIEKVVAIEREFSKIFDGGCHSAVGCSTREINGKIEVIGNFYSGNKEYRETIYAESNMDNSVAHILAEKIKKRISEEQL